MLLSMGKETPVKVLVGSGYKRWGILWGIIGAEGEEGTLGLQEEDPALQDKDVSVSWPEGRCLHWDAPLPVL